MKKITIKDVAMEAGTSISAVSHILNESGDKKYSEKTIMLVKNAAKKLNYVPNNIARGMRTQLSHSIGIVNFWDMSNHIFVKNLKGIVETANKYKYSVVICPVSNDDVDDYSYIDYYTNKRIDGIIFLAPVASERVINEEEHIKRMKEADVPFVVINTSLNSNLPNFFKYDFFNATYTATQYLAERKYTDITYVSHNMQEAYPEISERLNGYKQAVKELNIKEKTVNIEAVDKEVMRGFQAVVTSKSEVAKQIMDKAIDFGFKIPDDFSVIAANFENYSEFLHVPLTCAHIPILRIAEEATCVLMNIINKQTYRETTDFKCEIFEGKTVK